MMPLLVSPTAKQGIRHQTIGSMMLVSWNRSSSDPGREPATHAIKAEKKPLAADRMRESLAAMKADRRWTFGHN